MNNTSHDTADQTWANLHQYYQGQDWINKPSLFAQTVLSYFPQSGRVLELGAGQGQDSRFFAGHGYDIVSTDLDQSALELSRSKMDQKLAKKITLQQLDLRQELPFASSSFDIVYAHLSLHYFPADLTARILFDVQRVLKPGGILAFLVNATSDPEYGTGRQLEPDYFEIEQVSKRYFSTASLRSFTKYFDILLLDNHGETYKDNAKGVHNLIRFIGEKPVRPAQYDQAIPCAGAIIERTNERGDKDVLIQTRQHLSENSIYNGTLEFPIGRLDHPYETIFDTLAREIREESGLILKAIHGDARTKVISPQNDAAFGFKPFCCTQQLKNGKPWISFVFICEVEPGEPKAQLSEAKNSQWIAVSELRRIYLTSPEKIFTLQSPAWEYYFKQTITKINE